MTNPMMFPVSQEIESLIEYRESLEEQHQEIECLAITLEENPEDLSPLRTLRDLFDELWISSTKLNLAPISETVETLVQGFDLIISQNRYPPLFSEYLLLLTDRLLMLAKDVEYSSAIDMLKAQQLHVSLQDIVLSKSSEALFEAVPKAINHIVQGDGGSQATPEDDGDILLFDDFNEDSITLFDDEPGNESITLFDDDPDDSVTLFDEPAETESDRDIEIFIPDAILNPVAQALDYIRSKQEEPLTLLADMTDEQTHHGSRHTLVLHEIALAMNFMVGSPVEAEDLWASICLHDIGLAQLSDILTKEERLTEEEIEKVREHPLIGAKLADRIVGADSFKTIILEHHERIDGRGYPFGLKKDQISEGGKLLAIVDSFHAMISQRPYKRYHKNILRAAAEINACSGSQYDPRWVECFNTCIRQYWVPWQKKRR